MARSKELKLLDLKNKVDSYVATYPEYVVYFLDNVLSWLALVEERNQLSLSSEDWGDFNQYMDSILKTQYKETRSLELLISNDEFGAGQEGWVWYQKLTGARSSVKQ